MCRLFSLLSKKDPLKEKLKQAKKRTGRKDREFCKKVAMEQKEEARISTYLHNGICPECGEAVKHTTNFPQTGYRYTKNLYLCTKCTFKKTYLCDDEDEI
ncbi:hypothetical protein LCGC14_2498550 [marine sediment metagenome]|uniref:Uncharacterized protein n=1 Tax=marine sediment metagenome TaxID=412755 RepID=A0A0F9B2H4_9ZZZZ